jgi:ATP-dependent Lon protease
MIGPGVNDFYTIKNAEADSNGLIEATLIPLRDVVIFPNMIAPLFIGRDRSLGAINAAHAQQTTIIGVAQKDSEMADPAPDDLYMIGTELAVGRPLRMPDGSTSALAQGRRRVQVVEVIAREPYYRVRARVLTEEPVRKNREVDALMRAVLTLFQKCIELNRELPDEAYVYAMNVEEPGWLADMIASALDLNFPDLQGLIENTNPLDRLQRISVLLGRELDVLELEESIQSQVQTEVDRSQREMFLREQLRVIQGELGETDIFQQELNELRDKIEKAGMPDEVFQKALKEFGRLNAMPPMSPEVGIIRSYLDWLVELPWTKQSEDNLDIDHAAKVLSGQHFGLPKAKDRIIEHIAVRKLAPDEMRSPILCFVGPPGTGKTSLGESIAEALGRDFVRVSLGGVRDEAEIRGHRRTYIGALPGRIIHTMRRAGSINPVFMLDEIDKLGQDFRGDPAAALLEVLDPEQNKDFTDHYLDLPYDLSNVLFITTANTLDTLPPALLDRLEVIEFSGYIEEEKLAIARQFLIPRQLKQHGLTDSGLKFEDTALQTLIREYTYEAGVRNLEREIAHICRKIARKIASKQRFARKITSDIVNDLLGPPQFLQSKAEETDQVGVATALTVSDNGGDIMAIEVSLLNGKGGMTLTGSLGEVMKESAEAALSYTRSRAKELGIRDSVFDKTDIHVHLPEGGVQKEGPSAGITLATALISAFTGRKIYRTVAMTGEITLRGRVLPIGGIKEKVLAAHRAGLKTVIYPKRNEKDLIEIPAQALKQLTMIPVSTMEEVLAHAIEPASAVAKPPRKPRASSKLKVVPAAAGAAPGAKPAGAPEGEPAPLPKKPGRPPKTPIKQPPTPPIAG